LEYLCELTGRQKLIGPNYLEWELNLRKVLKTLKMEKLIDLPLKDVPPETAHDMWHFLHSLYVDKLNLVYHLMKASLSADLQEECKGMHPYEMKCHLGHGYEHQARAERLKLTRELFSFKCREGQSVGAYGDKVLRLAKRLNDLGAEISDEMQEDIIVNSLPESYSGLVYYLNQVQTGPIQLVNRLKDLESQKREFDRRRVLKRKAKEDVHYTE
jgi:hypothetical protein